MPVTQFAAPESRPDLLPRIEESALEMAADKDAFYVGFFAVANVLAGMPEDTRNALARQLGTIAGETASYRRSKLG